MAVPRLISETNEGDKSIDLPAPHSENEYENTDRNTVHSLESLDISAYYANDKPPECPVERVKFQGLDNIVIDSSDEIKHRKLPAIPDGGWGWVVVAAAFLVSACADGLAFSFGQLQKEFVKHFEASQSETSMIGSLFIASPLLAGPVMSALVDRYGCRVMTIIAGLVSAIGFLLASTSQSIAVLCLTFGFMSGLAMGILYVTAVVSVAFWFEKRRNLAVSLASCGIGFGTMVYAPMINYLLPRYEWRDTIVLLAGTLLNMCVCGALMRNPDWLEIKQKRDRALSRSRSRASSRSGSVSSRSLAESEYLGAEELKSLLESGKSPEYILAALSSSIKEAEELEATTQMNAEQTYKRMHSAIHLPTFIQRNDKVPPEVIEKLMENKRLYNVIIKKYPDLLMRRRSDTDFNAEAPLSDAAIEPAILPIEIKAKKSRAESESSPDHNEAGDAKVVSNGVPKDKNSTATKPKETPKPPMNLLRQISSFTTTDHHYLRDMPLYKNGVMHRGAMLSMPQRYKLKASSLPDMYRNSMESLDSLTDDEMKWHNRMLQMVKSIFDIKMFTEFHFLMYNISSLIFSIWFIVPFFYLEQFMSEAKMDGGSTMIAIIGVFSSIGIVALGWAGDQPWINVTKTYAVCMIICGLSIAAYPLVIKSSWGLAFISAIFGLSLASSYSYTPAILMELMPIDRFTMAYGLILLSQGIGHLVGPPIAGALFDWTKTWDLTFIMAGIWLVVSGIFIGVIAFTKDMRICGTAQLLKEAEEAEKSENDDNGPVAL